MRLMRPKKRCRGKSSTWLPDPIKHESARVALKSKKLRWSKQKMKAPQSTNAFHFLRKWWFYLKMVASSLGYNPKPTYIGRPLPALNKHRNPKINEKFSRWENLTSSKILPAPVRFSLPPQEKAIICKNPWAGSYCPVMYDIAIDN